MSEDEIRARSLPLGLARLAVLALEVLLRGVGRRPLGAHVEQVDEEVVGELPGGLGEDAVRGAVPVGVEGAETADEGGELGRGQGQLVGFVDEEVLGSDAVGADAVVAEAVDDGLEVLERLDVGLLLGGVAATGGEGHGETGGLLERGDTTEDDEIGEGHLLAARGRAVELLLDALESRQHGFELRSVVDLPVDLGVEADAGTIGAATLVATTERGCSGPSSADEVSRVNIGGQDFLLQLGNVSVVDKRVVHSRHGVFPKEDFLRDLRTEPAGSRAHITVEQLEPGTCECVVQLVGVLEPPTSDLLVGRVETQGQVRGQHAWLVLLVGVKGIGNDLVVGLCNPLVGTSRTLCELPLVLVEIFEVLVSPLVGLRGPDDLQSRSDGVRALAAAVLVVPAKALLVDGSSTGLRANVVRVGSTVRLTEGVSTNDEGSGLLVVHGHAAEGCADIACRGDGVRDAVRSLGVHVDETHVCGGQRSFQIARVDIFVVGLGALVAVDDTAATASGTSLAVGVADVVAQPCGLSTPVDRLVGFVCVGSAASEAEGGAAHGLEGDVAGEQVQVGPGDLVAVLLLDGPEQAAGLVERDVVGPAVEGSKSLLALAAATTTVGDAVGTGAVPGHADEEAAVVAVVGRPPVLRVGHQLGEVLLDGIVVQALEGLGILEVLVLGVGDACVLAEDVEAKLVGPPVAVPGAAAADVCFLDGALCGRHDCSSSWVSRGRMQKGTRTAGRLGIKYLQDRLPSGRPR